MKSLKLLLDILFIPFNIGNIIIKKFGALGFAFINFIAFPAFYLGILCIVFYCFDIDLNDLRHKP